MCNLTEDPAEDLVANYCAGIRSSLDYTCSVFHYSLPHDQYLQLELESVQKRALACFSQKTRKLYGPEKPLVKLRPAYSIKLVFFYVKIKITAKFRDTEHLRFEDTKGSGLSRNGPLACIFARMPYREALERTCFTREHHRDTTKSLFRSISESQDIKLYHLIPEAYSPQAPKNVQPTSSQEKAFC